METWQNETLRKLNTLCYEQLERWTTMVSTMGVPDSTRKEWTAKFLDEIKCTFIDMYQDLEERQSIIQKSILDLRKKTTNLCFSMGTPAEFPKAANLYAEESSLKQYCDGMESLYIIKQAEVEKLKDRQERICKLLGKTPKSISDNPLPSKDDLEDLVIYIESLEDECFLREEKYTQMQTELQTMAMEAGYKPANEFEAKVLTNGCHKFEVTDKNMLRLKNFHQFLEQHMRNILTECDLHYEQIKTLWATLDIDKSYCHDFMMHHTGSGKSTVEALKNELARLAEIKRDNLEALVKRVRVKIMELWDLCKYSQEQRDTYDIFNDNLYTESHLNNLQLEMNRLKKHYEDNKLIYEAFEKYEECWKKLIELDTPIPGHNRLKNRGGQLLQEEKDRKHAKKRIEKLEPQMRVMTEKYYNHYHTNFLYNGYVVGDFIKLFHEPREDMKGKQALSSRSVLSASKSAYTIGQASKSSLSTLNFYKQTPNTTNITASPKQSVRKELNSNPSLKHKSSERITESAIQMSKSRRNKHGIATMNKRKALMMLEALKTDCSDLETVHNIHGVTAIVDTTMPALYETLDADKNGTINESSLAMPLADSIIQEIESPCVQSTPPSYHNVTKRRKIKLLST